MASGLSAGGIGAGTQIIDGQSYGIYTPEWYEAMNRSKVKEAGVQGTAEGTKEANKLNTLSPALQGLFGALGDKMTSGTTSGSGSFGGGPGVGAPVTGVAPVDTSEAVRSEFADAKDQVGQETGGALTGLRAALAGRGMLGSGAESRGTAAVITKGQGELGKTSRAQATEGADLAQKNAETNYSGAVTQRGQDIQREQNVMQAQAQQAQVQLQQRQVVLNGLMAALSGAIQSY